MNKLNRLCSNLRSSLWFRRSLVRRATCQRPRVLRAALLGFLWWSALATAVMAQEAATGPQDQAPPNKEDLSLAPTKVDVQPVAHDEEIRKRLQSVLEATGWFTDPQVQVRDGVVFLSGLTETDEIKKWAGDLARNTQDVAAVANRIELSGPSVWDFRGARSGLRNCGVISSAPSRSLSSRCSSWPCQRWLAG